MIHLKKLSYARVFCLILGTFILLPFAPVQASDLLFPNVGNQLYQTTGVSNTVSKITYHDVHLSDLTSEVLGTLGEAKISVPSSIGISASTSLGISDMELSEVGGSFSVRIRGANEFGLDKNNNFLLQGSDILLKDYIKDIPYVTKSESEKGVFQGFKDTPTQTFVYSITSYEVETYAILIYDPKLKHAIEIVFSAPIGSSKLNHKIWQNLIKSINGVKKSSSQNSKKATTNNKLSSVPYEGTYFTMKTPAGWTTLSKDQNGIKLADADKTVIIQVDADDAGLVDYDSDQRSFWLQMYLAEFQRQMDGFEFVSAKDVTIDGLPGLRINYRINFNGILVEGYILQIVKDGIVYTLNVNVKDKKQWKKYQSVITKSLATFKRK